MLEIRGVWHCHMSRWDRYVLRPWIWMETSRSGTVPHIGPYSLVQEMYEKDRRYLGKRMALLAWKLDDRGTIVNDVVVLSSGLVGGNNGVYRRIKGGETVNIK